MKFEYIAAIAIVGILAGVAIEWIKSKKNPPVDLEPIEGRLAKLESLEERVKVLEKIVTDKNYDLNQEIENLR